MDAEMAKLFVRFTGEADQYLHVLKQVRAANQQTAHSVGSMKESLDKLGKMMKGGAVGVGIGIVFHELKKEAMACYEAFEKIEKIDIRLNAVLEANGRAVSTTRQEYEQFAEAQREVTDQTKLQTLHLLTQAETYGLTGRAAEEAATQAAALSKITGHSADAMMRMTAMVEEGDLKRARMMGRMFPQLRGVKDDTEFLEKYNKLVEAGNIAMAEHAETAAAKWERLKEKVEEVEAHFGRLLAAAAGNAFDKLDKFLFGGGKGKEDDTLNTNESGFYDAKRARRFADRELAETARALEQSKKTQADYDAAIKRLRKTKADLDDEFKRRSNWDVSWEEIAGVGPRDEVEAKIKALEKARERAAKPVSTEAQLAKNVQHDYDEQLKTLEKKLRTAGLTADQAIREELAHKGLSTAQQDELEKLEKKVKLQGELNGMLRNLEEEARKARAVAGLLRPEDIAAAQVRALGGSDAQAAQAEANKHLARMAEVLKKTLEELQTPQEKLKERMDDLNELFREGRLTLEEYARAAQTARDKILGLAAASKAQDLYGSAEDIRRRGWDYRFYGMYAKPPGVGFQNGLYGPYDPNVGPNRPWQQPPAYASAGKTLKDKMEDLARSGGLEHDPRWFDQNTGRFIGGYGPGEQVDVTKELIKAIKDLADKMDKDNFKNSEGSGSGFSVTGEDDF